MTDESKRPVPKGERFTDEEVVEAVRDAIRDIKESYYGYGQIIVTVSGRETKHVNIEIPYRGRPSRR